MKVLTSQMSVLKDFQKGIFTVGSLYKVLTPGPTLPLQYLPKWLSLTGRQCGENSDDRLFP